MDLGTDLSYSAWDDNDNSSSGTMKPKQSPAAATTSSELELIDDETHQNMRELFAKRWLKLGKGGKRGF